MRNNRVGETTIDAKQKMNVPSQSDGIYRKCIQCNRLVRNIYDHLLNKHKIKKSSENYSTIVKSCLTIPSILTKKNGNTTIMLDGDEYLAICKKISEMSDHGENGDLKRQLYEYQNENLRNLDSDNENPEIQESTIIVKPKRQRIFNEKTTEWKRKYVQHLNKKKIPDAIRRGNIAIDILQPYQENLK